MACDFSHEHQASAPAADGLVILTFSRPDQRWQCADLTARRMTCQASAFALLITQTFLTDVRGSRNG